MQHSDGLTQQSHTTHAETAQNLLARAANNSTEQSKRPVLAGAGIGYAILALAEEVRGVHETLLASMHGSSIR